MGADQCRVSAEKQRVGHLATCSSSMQPHIVPVTFAFRNGSIVIGIDEKPKSTTKLKRLRNILENPRVSLMWDEYDEDWTKLWWVRGDGVGLIIESGLVWEAAWAALNAKYLQYQGSRHEGPCMSVEIDSWSGWSYS
jgi:PPOX class probable F420-dependent enzyme